MYRGTLIARLFVHEPGENCAKTTNWALTPTETLSMSHLHSCRWRSTTHAVYTPVLETKKGPLPRNLKWNKYYYSVSPPERSETVIESIDLAAANLNHF
jgi:hypothetical protein